MSTQFTEQFAKTAMTASPLVGCVVWNWSLGLSLHNIIFPFLPVSTMNIFSVDL